jgi:O-antigen/teichoic acid export membrane protein
MTQGNFSSIGRRLLSGSLLRMSNLVAGAVASFFLMPFIVHHLGDRIYGFWSLAAAFIGYYSLLDLGLSSAISQYMCIAIGRKDHPECRVVFNTAFGLQLLVGVAALLVTGLVAAATPLICHNPADARLFWKVILILGVNTALGFPTRVYWAVLEAQLRFDVQSWLANLGLALRTGLIVWAVLSGGGLLALSWMALISTVPVTALQVWLARREAPWARIDTGFFKPKMVKSFFSYSFYSFTVYLGDIVRFQIDPLVISGLIGLAAVTHYKVAGVLAQYYLQIIIVSVGMLLPVLSRFHGAGNRQALEEVFFFGTKLSCCVSVLIFFGLAGWGRPLIGRWMGASYLDGYLPLVLLSFSVLLDGSQKSSIDLLFATFNHRFYAWINCGEALINLVLSLALARPYGILGVAMGTLIGAFVFRVVVQPWWVCRVSGLDYFAYMRFYGNNVLRCSALACAAMALSAWGLKPNYFWLAASAVCASGLYAAGAWWLVFNPGERQQLLRAFRGNRALKPGVAAAVGEAVQ